MGRYLRRRRAVTAFLSVTCDWRLFTGGEVLFVPFIYHLVWRSGRVGSSRVESSRGIAEETLNQKRNEEDSGWGITVDLCGCERYKAEQTSPAFLFTQTEYRNTVKKKKKKKGNEFNSFKIMQMQISKRLAKPKQDQIGVNNSLNNRKHPSAVNLERP